MTLRPGSTPWSYDAPWRVDAPGRSFKCREQGKRRASSPSALVLIAGIALALLFAASRPASSDILRQSQLPVPPGRINHAPGIIELRSGRLLACWYSGTTEANVDTVILCSSSSDAGATWSAPWQIAGPGEQGIGAAARNKSLGNIALYEDKAGRLWIIHGVIQRWTLPIVGNVCVNWYCGRVDARLSLDEGRTWSAPVRFDDQSGALPRAKPLHHPMLGDLVPLYREGPHTAHVRALNLAAVSPGEVPASRILPIPGHGTIQPSLVLLPGGQVRTYLRDSRRVAIRTSVLDPATASWSPPVSTDLPNPDSGIDAFADDVGDIVVIYNPSTTNRRTLALAASRDGIHFPRRCALVPTGAEGDVAYPVVIRARDRTWHVIYSAWAKTTVRHFRFDSAWLQRCVGR
ncbi:MAG: exo-alpha-sialidase [Acetobacteraceae bacterium]|nr:exo-alpha-sialidase [Acetobacteraceae bacterium]